jgi:nucleotide-binding universal stress UspA family protein
MTLPRTILVATDFSEHADHALEYAAELARQLDATLHLVHAITIPVMGVAEMGVAYSAATIESITKHAQEQLDTRTARYRDRVSLAPVRLEVGDARDTIDRAAEQIGADLIVIGTHGRRGLRRVLLGSIAESVVRSAPCPVLTIRQAPVTSRTGGIS